MTQNKKPFLWIENIVAWSLNKPKQALILSLTFIVLSFPGFFQLKLELDLYDSYNSEFPSLMRFWNLREEFQDGSGLFILAEWPKTPSGEQLCKFLHKLDTIERSQVDTKSVFHIFKARYVKHDPDRYAYPTILDEPCFHMDRTLADHLEAWDIKNPFQIANVGSRELLIQVQFENHFKPQSAGEWINQMRSTEYKTSYVGPATFRYYISETIKRDSFFHIFVILFFIFFIRFFLGTWKIGLFYMLTLGLTSLCLAGFMGSLGFPIDVLSNNLFLLTSIAGTADFLFVGWGLKQGRSTVESFLRFSRPCLFTTLTTMIGFLSLLTSDLNIIQRFGVAAALGAAFEWIFTFITLPALISIFGLENSLVRTKMDNWLNKLIQLTHRSPSPLVSIAFVILSAAAPFLFSKLRFEENPLKNFPRNHDVSTSHQRFIEKVGWQGALHLIFPVSIEESKVNSCLQEIKKSPLVKATQNPFEIKQHFTKGLSPLRQEAVESTLKRFGALKGFFGTESLRVPVFLTDTSSKGLDGFHQVVASACGPVAQIAGQSDVYREVSNLLSHTLTESFISSLVLVLLIVFSLQITLRNRDYGAVTVSIIAGPFAMITLMAIFDVSISPMNSLFLAVLVGITGDNAIQYLFATENSDLQKGTEEVGTASIVIGAVMIISSLFFLFQTLLPMKTLGVLFATGFLLNLIGDLWLLKGLLSLKLRIRSTLFKSNK